MTPLPVRICPNCFYACFSANKLCPCCDYYFPTTRRVAPKPKESKK